MSRDRHLGRGPRTRVAGLPQAANALQTCFKKSLVWVVVAAVFVPAIAGCASAPRANADAARTPNADCRLTDPLAPTTDAFFAACKTIQSDPHASIEQYALAALYVGEAQLTRGDIAGALQSLNRADEFKNVFDTRSRARLRNALGRSFLAQRNVDAAIVMLKEAASLDVADPRLTYDLGVGLLAKGDLTEAQRALDAVDGLARKGDKSA